MIDIRLRVEEAIGHIRPRIDGEPGIGLILGTGLGGIIGEMEKSVTIPYADIPHFPLSTVASHHGQLVFGRWAGKPLVAL